jgi:hypothetical protein
VALSASSSGMAETNRTRAASRKDLSQAVENLPELTSSYVLREQFQIQIVWGSDKSNCYAPNLF